MNEEREYSARRFAVSAVFCPACRGKLERESPWCPACGFTGSKTLDMFGDNPPPLLPLLDVADIWSAKDERLIKAAVARFNRRFPQIRWRICGVALGPGASLPLFGFWLLNASPLAEGETSGDRSWTVLLLVDAVTRRASVTAGYRAEVWLSDDAWEKALAESGSALSRGAPGLAISRFLETSRALFEKAWNRSQKQIPSRNVR
jgi:hypothetical protein